MGTGCDMGMRWHVARGEKPGTSRQVKGWLLSVENGLRIRQSRLRRLSLILRHLTCETDTIRKECVCVSVCVRYTPRKAGAVRGDMRACVCVCSVCLCVCSVYLCVWYVCVCLCVCVVCVSVCV